MPITIAIHLNKNQRYAEAQRWFHYLFDPTDDGSTEDDFFDETDPERRLGPSSLCFPEFVFVHQGDTDEPFQVNNIGRATEAGSGLAGNTGDGCELSV